MGNERVDHINNRRNRNVCSVNRGRLHSQVEGDEVI